MLPGFCSFTPDRLSKVNCRVAGVEAASTVTQHMSENSISYVVFEGVNANTRGLSQLGECPQEPYHTDKGSRNECVLAFLYWPIWVRSTVAHDRVLISTFRFSG